MTVPLVSLFWIALCSALAPMLSWLTRRRVPDVVWLLLLGVLIGPHMLQLASQGTAIAMVRELGLGMLFLSAGFEIDPTALRSRQGVWGVLTWCASLVLAVTTFTLALPGRSWMAAIAFGIAMTSTALGTLLPILRDANELGKPVGSSVLIHGAIGEVAPIIVMALLLTQHGPVAAGSVLMLFVVITLVMVMVPFRVIRRVPGVNSAVSAMLRASRGTVLRLVMLLLTGLMALSAVLKLDIVLGAFAAGLLVRVMCPPPMRHTLSQLFEVIGMSLLVPAFFVTSGMAIDAQAVARYPLMVAALVLAIALSRGLPIFLAEHWGLTSSGLPSKRDQARVALYSATGLPIIVAVTALATERHIMSDLVASTMVAAGAATVLLFPLVAALIDPDGGQR